MNKFIFLVFVAFTILSSNFLILAKPDELKLTVFELKTDEKGCNTVYAIPSTDDSKTNPDYSLLSMHWYTTVNYYVNPFNKYGYSQATVVNTIIMSAGTWDSETSYEVFSYKGTTTRTAGKYDGFNVVSWGKYRKGIIGVTYLWSIGGTVVETDTTLNNLYSWSLSGGSGKMDLQNIMTHEFGHWCGLDDLYDSKDYYLTMYGYSGYGITYQRDLGIGDINGLKAVYSSLIL